ncbi:hypothetical protein T4C_11772 [Trichinella pseudospiralis]|uniref:Uncharacterized protein n=1 Tax=Trichinella pseudospiralis TaxID=6337 RepID=A0A0V1JSZ8_TRIPS|nr:hypothetical protein T4C_11772 [Trichinella pseudospiralis]
MNRKTNHLRQEEAAYEEKTERGEDEEEQLSVDRRETSCRLIGYQRCQMQLKSEQLPRVSEAVI